MHASPRASSPRAKAPHAVSPPPLLLLLPPLLLLLLLLPLPQPAAAKMPLPPYIKPCSLKLSAKEMTKCAVKHANEVVPAITNGDRKYRVPPVNPLLVDRLQVDNGQGPLGLNMLVSQVKVYGIPKTTVNNVEFDWSAKKARYDAFLPVVNVQAKYNVSGRVLLLPIMGHGDANLTLENVHVTYEYDFDLKKLEDGETYFIPKPHNDFRFNTTRLYVHLDNLFNGDKLLGETTNKFMDENWEEILVAVGPIFSTAISEIIHNLLTNIFKLVPFTEAFLDTDVLKVS